MKAVCAILRLDCQIYYSGSVFFDKAGPVELPGGHSKRVPPESISNSEVKTLSADDSAGVSRVKVGTAGHLLVPQMPAPFFWNFLDYGQLDKTESSDLFLDFEPVR